MDDQAFFDMVMASVLACQFRTMDVDIEERVRFAAVVAMTSVRVRAEFVRAEFLEDF